MKKEILCTGGIIGIVAAAVYIYKEYKKKKEPESLVYIDDANAAEETEQVNNEKTESIKEKISVIAHKTGKAIGTAALKIKVKYPKATQFVCKYSKFLPAAIVIGCTIIASINKKPRWPYEPKVDDDIITETLYDERFADPLYIETYKGNVNDAIDLWKSTELNSNFLKLKEFLDSLNLEYSERYMIENKESYADAHPNDDLSSVQENYVISQTFNVNKLREHQAC